MRALAFSKIVVAAALAAVTISALLADGLRMSEASGRRHVVEIRRFKFVPAELDAAPGDTIVWVNRDIVPHTVTAADRSWDSGEIQKDSEWQTIVGDEISGEYFCRFHPAMKASVQIAQ